MKRNDKAVGKYILTFACAAMAYFSAAIAEESGTSPLCENPHSSGEYVEFSLVMELENRRLPMHVPRNYFEDRWDLVDGAEHTAQRFSLDFETLRPLKLIERHRLNKQGKLNLLSVLLGDTVGPFKRLRYAISAAQGWSLDKDSIGPIDEIEFKYGLKEVDLGTESYDRVFFWPSQNNPSPISIICTGARPVRRKLCRHYFRSNEGIDVNLTYPMYDLFRWGQTQERIEELISCFVSN